MTTVEGLSARTHILYTLPNGNSSCTFCGWKGNWAARFYFFRAWHFMILPHNLCCLLLPDIYGGYFVKGTNMPTLFLVLGCTLLPRPHSHSPHWFKSRVYCKSERADGTILIRAFIWIRFSGAVFRNSERTIWQKLQLLDIGMLVHCNYNCATHLVIKNTEDIIFVSPFVPIIKKGSFFKRIPICAL